MKKINRIPIDYSIWFLTTSYFWHNHAIATLVFDDWLFNMSFCYQDVLEWFLYCFCDHTIIWLNIPDYIVFNSLSLSFAPGNYSICPRKLLYLVWLWWASDVIKNICYSWWIFPFDDPKPPRSLRHITIGFMWCVYCFIASLELKLPGFWYQLIVV